MTYKIKAATGGLGNLAGTSITLGDAMEIQDVSDTAMSADGTNKYVLISDMIVGFRSVLGNYSTADQGAGFSTDTYITGSNISIPSGYPIVGTTYKLVFNISKTAAGTAAPTLNIRIGTAGTTADTSRILFTYGAGTAAADTGVIEVIATFRSVGATTSAVISAAGRLTSNLTTTGLSNAVKAHRVVSSGFDSTVANSIIGASWNGGTSAAHTISLVRAELIL